MSEYGGGRDTATPGAVLVEAADTQAEAVGAAAVEAATVAEMAVRAAVAEMVVGRQ